MKIAFTGTHRVGKTTLAEAIADSLPGYELKQEPYLQLEETGYLFPEVPTTDDYIEQFSYAVKQIENSEDNVIFDRCHLDILAYIYAVRKNKDIQTLYSEMEQAMSQIDLLIFVPIETPDIISCHESDLPRLRYQVNNILQSWIGDLNLEILEVKGSEEKRKQQVLKKLIQLQIGQF